LIVNIFVAGCVVEEKKMFAVLPARDAEWLQSRLLKEGIEVATIYNQRTCGSGCSPAKELWVHPHDVNQVQKIIISDRMKALEDLGADLTRINQVFDDSKSHATCPACGCSFDTKGLQCPDCGLSFA
jgi:hypothetical protein